MARQSSMFEKIVLTPGVYRTVKNGVARELDSFSAERIRRIAETGQRMLDNGLRIPLPFVHFDSKGELPHPVTVTADGQEVDPVTGLPAKWDASINGGFAKAFYVNDDGALVVGIESFGDKDNLNDPAGKLGTTIQETSLGLASTYTDGAGIVYKDAPVHIAACIKAVEGGQTNFVLLDDDVAKTAPLELVTMSQLLMSTSGSVSAAGAGNNGQNNPLSDSDQESPDLTGAPNLPQLLQLLKKLKCPIDLPGDTTVENLVERLNIALLQIISYQENEQEDEEEPKPPKGAQEKTGYQTMTQQAGAAANTETSAAAAVPAAPTQTELTLMNMVAGTFRTAINDRIKKLVAAGLPQAWVDEKITPKLSVTVTSMSDLEADGKPKSLSVVEAMLDAVEVGLQTKVTHQTMSAETGYLGGLDMPNGAEEIESVDAATAAANKAIGDEFVNLITDEVGV